MPESLPPATTDLRSLTLDSFAKHVGEEFLVHAQDGSLVKTILTRAEDRGFDQRLEQFSVIFSAPAPVATPQGICRVEHSALGSFDIFLVLVGGNQEQLTYEAVFNRIRPTGDKHV